MQYKDLDAIDCRILAALQTDARLTNVELADKVNLTPSPCLRRLKRLEASGIISGYSAVLNRRNAGLGLTVFVDLKVYPHTRESAAELQQQLCRMPEVAACHIISGEADYRMEVVVPDLEAYEHFQIHTLLNLEGIQEVRSSFVIRTVKDCAPLPLNHLQPGA